MTPSSLFDQIGGAPTVAAIVEAFYQRVEADPPFRAIYPEDLAPGQEKLRLFFQQWLGGAPAYSELYGHPRLRRRHFPFVIDESAAGTWLRYMRLAWREAGVSEEVQGVVFERLGPLARHMVNASDDVPREPLPEGPLE